jgi:signal recognition particle GTPase
LLGEMKAVRSQLDRVESAVALLARGVRVAFEEVRVSLRSANNEEAMSELRELWATSLGSLETLVLSTKCSEAAILKEMRQVKVALEGKLLQLDVAPDLMDSVVGEVAKLREEMRLVTSEQMSELLEELKRVVG